MTIDPADLNIVTSTLYAIANEMADAIQRAAYSTIVREARDFSTCITDASGEMAAQSELIAVHMNSLAAAMDYARAHHDFSTLVPGDAFIVNNPYENGQHLNDVIIILPVFHREKLAAFVGTICHHLELGGAVAGSNANATEIFHEGLVLPLMRVNFARDLDGGPIEKMIMANVRMPDVIGGDYQAQLASLRRGEALMLKLFDRYGVDLVSGVMREIQDQSERLMRETIAAIPDGDYRGEDTFDGPSLSGKLHHVRAHVAIRGSEVTVDLSASDDQVSWPVNAPLASTYSAVLTLFGSLLDGKAPVNAGTYRPIHIVTRKGSVVDPTHPAPVRGRMTSIYRVYTAVKRALAGVIPDRLAAAGNDSSNLITFSHRGPDGYLMFTESVSGGSGGNHLDDGEEAISQSLVNTSNTPVEAIEMRFPFIRVREYGLAVGSGGHGRHRGGLGIRRAYEVLADEVLLSANGDRHESRPWGLDGGTYAASSSLAIWRNGQELRIPAAVTMKLERGDVVVVELCGGGGYGNPRERDRQHVLDDVKSGRVSTDVARDVYGLEEEPAVLH